MGSYKSICRNLDLSLVDVSKRLSEKLDHEARSFQHGVRDAVRVAAVNLQGFFLSALMQLTRFWN